MANDTPQKNTSSESSQKNDVAETGSSQESKGNENQIDLAQVQAVLENLRVIRKPISVVPTNLPKNFMEQIQYYENGATRRLYIYISHTWRFVALT